MDNLSCPQDPVEAGECFSRSGLCDGLFDCAGGDDEGSSFSALECLGECRIENPGPGPVLQIVWWLSDPSFTVLGAYKNA